MAMNRVQFQPGLSMIECMDRYGSDDKCEAALIESRWPAGFACPACGSGGAARRTRRERIGATRAMECCAVASKPQTS